MTSPSISTRPYLLRALYEWCADNGFTPFIAVAVDATVAVPVEYVKDGEIVLNISMDATSGLQIGNDAIEFKGRFGGVARDIFVPVGRVLAIYARENGQGMAFPLVADAEMPVNPAVSGAAGVGHDSKAPSLKSVPTGEGAGMAQEPAPPSPPKPSGARPTLTRIK